MIVFRLSTEPLPGVENDCRTHGGKRQAEPPIWWLRSRRGRIG